MSTRDKSFMLVLSLALMRSNLRDLITVCFRANRLLFTALKCKPFHRECFYVTGPSASAKKLRLSQGKENQMLDYFSFFKIYAQKYKENKKSRKSMKN